MADWRWPMSAALARGAPDVLERQQADGWMGGNSVPEPLGRRVGRLTGRARDITGHATPGIPAISSPRHNLRIPRVGGSMVVLLHYYCLASSHARLQESFAFFLTVQVRGQIWDCGWSSALIGTGMEALFTPTRS